MSTEANKALARRAVAALNQANWAELVSEFSPTEAEAQEFIQEHRLFRHAFPDYHATIQDLIAEGDQVVVRQTVRATHMAEFPAGELMGIAATGRQLEWTEVSGWRIVGGKIVDGWLVVDGVSRLQQLGVLPVG